MKPLTNFFRGLLIGAADILPAVSGGTIAFILGIYPQFLQSIGRINLVLLILLRYRHFGLAWKYINGNFICWLFLGIISALFSVAKLISWLLDHCPNYLWGFFLGILLFSSKILLKNNRPFNIKVIICLLIGIIISAGISFLPFLQDNVSPSIFLLFFSGMLAITAMVLPGISGSFILLLLGVYQAILNAVSKFDLAILFPLLLGIVFGLVFLVKIFSYLFNRFYLIVFALLTGFVLGSLVKLINNSFKEVKYSSDYFFIAIFVVAGFFVGFLINFKEIKYERSIK